jgi:DNA-directed RNA polymerase subunit alpha
VIKVQEPNYKLERSPENNPFKGNFVIEPLEKGFGLTLGNSLRRVMLSAIPGVAISAVRIKGVMHEYSFMEGVQEDVLEILMNLKRVVLATNDEIAEPFKMYIEKSGKGAVVAGDIQGDERVKVINPEQHLCEVTGDDIEFVAELDVKPGRGYDQNWRGFGEESLDTMFVDGHFTPVKKVSYQVSDARVGQDINYDKLTIDIETNGAMYPEEVIRFASKMLKEYYGFLTTIQVESPYPSLDFQLEGTQEENVESNDDILIKDLEFSVRSRNCLEMGNIKTLGQLADVSIDELMQIKNFGKKSLTEIREKLSQYGLKLKDDREGS